MGAAAIAAGGLSAAGGIMSAQSQRGAGALQAGYYSYLKKTADMNAGLAQAQGRAATEQIGAEEGYQQRRLSQRVAQTVGAQKAAVANGVGASSKTAEQLVSDTVSRGNLDEEALRYNAALRTKAARMGADMTSLNDFTQGEGYAMAGQNAQASARMNSAATILGSAGSVANIWYRSPWGV